ncbi:hypothetical protein PspLS_08740 [Pyricularia sp. CBS 133598]|nr:hypothetical protein PspLS_08740 [Pyricularia sp. CBS 133598]
MQFASTLAIAAAYLTVSSLATSTGVNVDKHHTMRSLATQWTVVDVDKNPNRRIDGCKITMFRVPNPRDKGEYYFRVGLKKVHVDVDESCGMKLIRNNNYIQDNSKRFTFDVKPIQWEDSPSREDIIQRVEELNREEMFLVPVQ